MKRPHESIGSPIVGVAALVGAACVAGSAAVLAKVAYDAGGDPRSLISARFVLVGVLSLIVLTLTRDHGARLSVGLCAATGLTLFMTEACVLFAIERLPAAVTILILFSAPAWLALTERLAWNRELRPSTWFSIGAVLAGLLVMAWPFGSSLDLLGALLALAGAGFLAAFLLLLEASLKRSNPGRTVALTLIVAGLAGFVLDPTALGSVVDTQDLWPYVLGYAAVMAVWMVLLAAGIRTTGAITAAIISAIEPLWVAIAALVVLNEHLGLREIGGGLIVMAGVLLVSLAAIETDPAVPTYTEDEQAWRLAR